jgi:23S rRNA pseudouridine1911/1915/1917 synthase
VEKIKVQVSENNSNIRLDVFLSSEEIMYSRAQAQKAIKEGRVWVNSKNEKASFHVYTGDLIEIEKLDPVSIDVVPEDITLDVLFEDNSIIVINKPAGMVVHPAAGNYSGTLVNALLFHCKNLSGIGGAVRPGIVHRLDKGTSGVLVVAKNDKAHIGLSKQFEVHSVKRVYSALAYGVMKELKGVINLPIGRHNTDRKKMSTITRRGRDAITHWEVLESFDYFSLLRVILETGRTHQVRVHLSTIDHPIVNDQDYGTSKRLKIITDKRLLDEIKGLKRPLLHAGFLEFIHPETNETMNFKVPLTPDFTNVLNILRADK